MSSRTMFHGASSRLAKCVAILPRALTDVLVSISLAKVKLVPFNVSNNGSCLPEKLLAEVGCDRKSRVSVRGLLCLSGKTNLVTYAYGRKRQARTIRPSKLDSVILLQLNSEVRTLAAGRECGPGLSTWLQYCRNVDKDNMREQHSYIRVDTCLEMICLREGAEGQMIWKSYFMGMVLSATCVIGSCSPPSLGRDNAQCNTGNFNGCVSAKTVELSSLCNGDPALESACLQQATLRANKECAAFCMDVTDCTSCMKSIEMLGLSQNACENGDMNYCKC